MADGSTGRSGLDEVAERFSRARQEIALEMQGEPPTLDRSAPDTESGQGAGRQLK
jgi:hypothetical protein